MRPRSQHYTNCPRCLPICSASKSFARQLLQTTFAAPRKALFFDFTERFQWYAVAYSFVGQVPLLLLAGELSCHLLPLEVFVHAAPPPEKAEFPVQLHVRFHIFAFSVRLVGKVETRVCAITIYNLRFYDLRQFLAIFYGS